MEGVTLEADSKVVVCKSCELVKGERKAVSKVQEMEQCTTVEEIHSNLWGPAPVESINHKHYYVSFMDDYSRFTSCILRMRPSMPIKSLKPGCR